MGATTNVTTVHYGTTWDDATLLEEVKQANLELQKNDGIQRHFRFDWQAVAKFNPAYLQYVEGERARLGENHPLFQTQYALMPIQGGGRFFSNLQVTLLQGDHGRVRSRESGKIYVAGIDLAGEAEDQADIMLTALSPKRDSTVITIGELILVEEGDIFHQPHIDLVELYSWTGVKHSDLYSQMVDLISKTWRCQRVLVDATGIGQPVASFLKKACGGHCIKPFTFTQRSKSDIGFELLSFVNGSRLKVFSSDGSPEYQELFNQVVKAKSIYRPSQTMNFFVDPAEGHDDYLMSLALLVEAAKDYRPRVAKGTVPGE